MLKELSVSLSVFHKIKRWIVYKTLRTKIKRNIKELDRSMTFYPESKTACLDGHQDQDWNLKVGEYMAKSCTSVIDDLPLKLDECDCPNMDGSLKDQLKLGL